MADTSPAVSPDTATTIRAAHADDFPAASEMVLHTFRDYVATDYTDEGRETFRQFASAPDMEARWAEGNQFLIAERNREVHGLLEMDGKGHLSLLFVTPGSHRQGVARRLLEAALVERPQREITVNASTFAVPAYERLGFVITGPLFSRGGMRAVPMALDVLTRR